MGLSEVSGWSLLNFVVKIDTLLYTILNDLSDIYNKTMMQRY